MPLDKTALKTGIETMLTDLFNNGAGLTSATARTKFATDLSNLLETFVKSGDGVYQAGTLQAGVNPVISVPPGTAATIKIQ